MSAIHIGDPDKGSYSIIKSFVRKLFKVLVESEYVAFAEREATGKIDESTPSASTTISSLQGVAPRRVSTGLPVSYHTAAKVSEFENHTGRLHEWAAASHGRHIIDL